MWMYGVATTPSTPVPKKILDTEGRVDRFMRKYGMGGVNEAPKET